jgi:acyl-CoA synthetase (AMP-forming)/AMP-acid ligase II
MVKDIVAPWVERTAAALRRDLTLGTLLDRLATIHGERRLVDEAGGLNLTYDQAAKRVRRWSGGIFAKVEPGEVVVVATPAGYEQLLLCLAVARAGAIPAPTNAAMTKAELRHVVADSGARVVLHGAADVDGAEPLAEAVPAGVDDIAAVFYTSGTTGKPKGAELTNRALVGQLTSALAWPTGLRRDEAVLSLPTAHIMGFTAVLGMACAGIPVHFLPKFNPVKVLDAIEQRRATIFVGVPAMYRMLLEAGAEDRDLSSVRVWLSGADAMPSELASRFKRMGATVTLPFVGSLGEAAFAEGYGMVESGGGVAAKFSPPGLNLGLGSGMGFALPGYRFKVVDEEGAGVRPGAIGELWVKGPGVLKGYRGDAAATEGALTQDGWLRTGDLARKGPMGLVFFAGRQKDVIKAGGYSVYAVEVEQALEEHPQVTEAAVVPLPDDRDGEIPVAAVRLVEGASIDAEELGRWAEERLSSYKVPRRFLVVDELPRTGTNKVRRSEVVELFS